MRVHSEYRGAFLRLVEGVSRSGKGFEQGANVVDVDFTRIGPSGDMVWLRRGR